MMPATDYFEALVLSHAIHQQPFSIEDWYVGLWTSDPTSAGILTGEVAAADYIRKPVIFNTVFANLAAIEWANAVNDWGEVNNVCLINSPQKGSGNMLIYQPRDLLDVNPGIQVVIPAGGLTVALI